YTQDPQNLDTARRIAELYEEKNDLEKAVTWFSYAAQLSENTDFALVRKASDLRIRQFDSSIASLEEFLSANPDSADAVQYIARLEEIRTQRAQLLLDDAKKRVERNPTDLLLRFELGEV